MGIAARCAFWVPARTAFLAAGHRFGMRMATMPLAVGPVPNALGVLNLTFGRSVVEIRRAVVSSVSVDVVHRVTLWTRTDKGKRYENMDIASNHAALVPYLNASVSLTV
jgi:hypothetical protein